MPPSSTSKSWMIPISDPSRWPHRPGCLCGTWRCPRGQRPCSAALDLRPTHEPHRRPLTMAIYQTCFLQLTVLGNPASRLMDTTYMKQMSDTLVDHGGSVYQLYHGGFIEAQTH